MRVKRTVEDFQNVRAKLEGTVGFVATMGGLHAGHMELVDASISRCDSTIASIFVNPTQFDDPDDLENYPGIFEADLGQLREKRVDLVFVPDFESIYPDRYRYQVVENDFSKLLSGATRPGHFDGVLTVVMRLLNIVKPDMAFFGEKDYQQLVLIRGMVDSFFMDVRIEMVPTVRNKLGVALSSRNERLSDRGMQLAARFARELATGDNPDVIRHSLEMSGLIVEYIEDVDNRRFGSVVIDDVVLIDNVAIGGNSRGISSAPGH